VPETIKTVALVLWQQRNRHDIAAVILGTGTSPLVLGALLAGANRVEALREVGSVARAREVVSCLQLRCCLFAGIFVHHNRRHRTHIALQRVFENCDTVLVALCHVNLTRSTKA
jgi:uncharacterized membrane protein YhfC